VAIASVSHRLRALPAEASDYADPGKHLGDVRVDAAAQEADVPPDRAHPSDPQAMRDVHQRKQEHGDGHGPPLDESQRHHRSEQLDERPPGLEDHHAEQAGRAAHVVAQEARQSARLIGAQAMQRQPDGPGENVPAQP
jgi:hypothetical protein